MDFMLILESSELLHEGWIVTSARFVVGKVN